MHLLKYIDEIAREKQRTVLGVIFNAPPKDELDFFPRVDYENLKVRQDLIKLLDENGISWERCGSIANECVITGYNGQLYIDLSFDESLPQYQLVREFLEHPDGTMRYPEATFIYVPLEVAMKNAHHDEPGYWEDWAENF